MAEKNWTGDSFYSHAACLVLKGLNWKGLSLCCVWYLGQNYDDREHQDQWVKHQKASVYVKRSPLATMPMENAAPTGPQGKIPKFRRLFPTP